MLNRLKHTLRQIDRAVWLVLALSLLAAWAFILRPSLPRETDAELHVFRAAELGYSLRAGVLYPRWAPDFYYGYGYPIFNYYAPLTYYLANLLSLCIPGGAVFGARAVFILGFVLSGVGVYGLIRRLSTPQAAVIGAASYLFMPYIFLIDPHLRGDMAEFFALAVGPVVFWALTAFHHNPNRRNFLFASLAVAALILTHNLLALVYFAMAAAYTIWLALIIPLLTRQSLQLSAMIKRSLPLLAGLALAAFFWLPVALEKDAVQLGNLIGPGHFDYRNHFLTPVDLLNPLIPLDLGAVNPAFRFNLGPAQWFLASAGLAALVFQSLTRRINIQDRDNTVPGEEQNYVTLFWLLCLAGLVCLLLPVSRPLWDAIPMMAFLQFPWRLLGPAALSLAVAGSTSYHLLAFTPKQSRPYAYAALVALPLIMALPIFITPNWGDFGPTDQLAMLEFELNGLALGTTSTGDFVPAGVDVVPGPNPDLIASYRDGGPVDKVNRRTLPDGASVEIIRHRPTADIFAVSSPEGFILRLYTFMFDGWRASIDGEPAAIEIAKPEGFITVPVLPGEHVVRVWLGTTPARTLAVTISLCALAGMLVIAWKLPHSKPVEAPHPPIDNRPLYIILAVFIVVATLGGLLGLFQPRSTGLIAAPAKNRLHAYLQGGIDLIGYDLPVTAVESGQSLPVTLYWKAREPVPGNYQVFVHLTTVPQHTWGQSDKLNPGDYPTTRWPADRYVRDPHTLTVPLGTPPGEYTLHVGLWDRGTGIRQLVLAADGTVLGDSIELPSPLTIQPPKEQPRPEDLPLDITIDHELAPGMLLLGAQREPDEVFSQQSGLLKLFLYWQAGSDTLPDYVIALRLLDSTGTEIARTANRPVDDRYPTTLWASGQVVRDVHSFWINEALPSGTYTVEIGITQSGEHDPEMWESLTNFDRSSVSPPQ